MLTTDLFIKTTASLSYLHRNSCHPFHIFLSFPYGAFIRVRRNCSDLALYDNFSTIILNAFINKGYDRDALSRAQDQAWLISRTDLLPTYDYLHSNHNPTQSDQDEARNFHLILQHHSENAKIWQIVRHNWSLLGTSNKTTHLFNCRLVYGASGNPRLRDKLVNSSILIPPKYGQIGKISLNDYNTDNCEYCGYLDKSGQIRSHSLKRKFPAKKNICCKSHNIVYCLTCKICGLQYVGETKRTLQRRLYEHLPRYRWSKQTPGTTFLLPKHNKDTSKISAHILSFMSKPSDTSAALH